MATKTAKKPAAKKSTPTKKTPSVGEVVAYRLPSGNREVPAIVTAVGGAKTCLTVFEVTGPYVAHGVTHGAKAGCWH